MLTGDSRLPAIGCVLLAASAALAIEKTESFRQWDALSRIELGGVVVARAAGAGPVYVLAAGEL